MNFDYYTLFALGVTTRLLNTESIPTGHDQLTTVAELATFLDELADVGFVDEAQLPAPIQIADVQSLYRAARDGWIPTIGDLEAIRRLRSQIRVVFDDALSDPAAAIDVVNRQLVEHRAVPRISRHHDSSHLHFEAAEVGCVHWLAVTISMGLAIFICTGDQQRRLGICASSSCQRVFVDRSKNNRKAYCSDTCAHRESVTAYRARRKSAATAP